ncbi:MAG: hypothetical protein AB7F59_11345 [Bdellovibrionales bacterium]
MIESLVKIITSQFQNVMSPLLTALAMLIIFSAICFVTDDQYIKYAGVALVFIWSVFMMGIYVYNNIRNPERLHNEPHIFKMAQLGSRYVKQTVVDVPERELQDVIQAGTSSSYNVLPQSPEKSDQKK